jgi:CubicO group peptidase (beta-lactamase class C family)
VPHTKIAQEVAAGLPARRLTRRRVLELSLGGVGLLGLSPALIGRAAAETGVSNTANAARLGFSKAGVSALEKLFKKMNAEGLHPGAQLAVYRNGELAIEFAGGKMTPGGRAVTSDTLFQIRSTTKALTAMLMMQARDRGYFELDDPVAKHWPEFARNGKAAITIGHVLSHQAGIPDGPAISPAQAGNRKAVAAAVENMKPIWKPGTANGYHAASIGWISNELLRRWTGKAAHELLAENVAGPLGATDFYLGLPASEYPRMTHMVVDDRVRTWQTRRARFSDFLNTRYGISFPLSWASGVSNARSLGSIFSILAYQGTLAGRKYHSKDTQDIFSTPTNPAGRRDLRLRVPIRWGLGFILGDTPNMYFSAPRPRVLGHVGGSANIAWADPDNRLAVAFLSNKMLRWPSATDRTVRIGDAIYAALA